ncbi:MAG: methyltransferase domain-containing protein [Pseudanabaenaceae cyanobacterium bins.68]|nr:methyltransferase domain-containing protein [Pseudanabaenaceae cyanobacterium bins.68]
MTESAMASMYQYRVSRIWQDLSAQGKQNGSLKIEDLQHLDQYHYLGTAAIAQAAKYLQLTAASQVLDIGSGVGGTARYLAAHYGCKVTALELQEHLHAAGLELTQRCGLDHLVQEVNGDILEFEPGDAKFNAWISLLVFLHIGDRAKLFAKSRAVLQPGGRFYIEDYFQRRDLTESDLDILEHTVACPYLPSRDRYLADLQAAGYEQIEFEDVTDLWQPWVQHRLEQFVANQAKYESLHGAAMVAAQTKFYGAIAELYQAGNVGGARIWGRCGAEPI